MASLKLLSAEVMNFGPFADSRDVPIEPTVTVLLAENENGKTSFLRALSWFGSQEPLDSDDLWDGAASDEPLDIVALTFAGSKEVNALLAEAGLAPVDKIRIVRSSDGTYRFEDESGTRLVDLSESFDTVISARQRLAELLPGLALLPQVEGNRQQALALVGELNPRDAESANQLAVYIRDSLVPVVSDGNESELAGLVSGLLDHASAAEADAGATLLAKLSPLVPEMVFFDDQIDQLLDHVTYAEAAADPTRHQTMVNLAALVDEDLLTMAEREPRDLQRLSRRVTETVSESISQYWDGDQIKLHVSFVETQMLVDIEHRGRTQKPSRRSRGLAWFLGFYINFKARTSGDLKDAVLLIDEPGLFLHLKQQPMLLKLFDELARSNQILFTTHLPEMVPATALHRLRLLVPDEERQHTVKVVSNLNEFRSQGDVLQPVRAALGMGIAQAVGLGRTNVIVEGVADPYLVGAMRDFCAQAGMPTLSDDVTLFRAGGAGKKMLPYIGFLVTDRARGVVLVDDDREGRRVGPLVEKAYGSTVPVLRVVEEDGAATGREIEDIFSRAYYLDLVNEAHEAKVPNYASIELAELGDEPICDAVSDVFKRRKYGDFQKTLPARQLELRLQRADAPDPESLEAFAALFERLSRALEQAATG